MKVLRKSYQEWLGDSIKAKRARLRGEPKEPPTPVHLTKAVSFWDIFPEDPKVYRLVVQARAFQVLFPDINRATKETTIRYKRQTSVDIENVDLASNWEEVAQVLEIRACLEDREEIQRQVNAIYEAHQTPEQKQQLYQQLTNYLKQRATELEKLGGEDSSLYAREKTIVLDVIRNYKLGSTSQTQVFVANSSVSTPEPEPVTTEVNVATSEPEVVTNTPPASPSSNNLRELKELMEMFKQGLLTKEEFDAAKKQLLGL
jgi:hypothetical protein